MMKEKRPNCLQCKHFQVTWEKSHPRACKAFGFKGKELPSETVFKSTGSECPMFTPSQKTINNDGWYA